MRNLGLVILSSIFLLGLSACADIEADFADSTSSATGFPSYQFESESRAILEPLQVPSSRHPKLGMRASGGVYMSAVYEDEDLERLGLFISHNGGDAFAPPVPISAPGVNVSSHGENSPSLVFGTRRELYVLFEQMAERGATELMFARSLEAGYNFQKPYKITDKDGISSNAFSSLWGAPNGHVFAAWIDGRDDDNEALIGTSSVYIARSTDFGESFGKNISVASGICPCCRPSMAFGPEGEIYLSWRHVFENNSRDMVVAVSRDGGDSFGSPVRVAEDDWQIAGCPHTGSQLLQVEDRLYVAWFTAGNNREVGVQLTWSDDQAKSFAPPVYASEGVAYANHPMLTQADDGRLLLIFEGRSMGENDKWGPVSPFLVEIAAGGELTEPMAAPGNGVSITYPAVTGGSQGGVFVAWTEPTEEGTQIVMARGRRTTEQ